MKNQEINHIHFKSLESTQDYLIQHPELHNGDTLVSTSEQTQGVGQYGRTWDYIPGNLACSGIVEMNEIPTLTSLEMSLLICEYFKDKYKLEIKTKWPNDLLTSDRRKVGGILLQSLALKKAVVGIGINYLKHDEKSYPYQVGSLDLKINPEIEAYHLYHYILTNRKDADQVLKQWPSTCVHFNQKIKFRDSQEELSGIFKGIGKQGQALIETKSGLSEYFSGSIFSF